MPTVYQVVLTPTPGSLLPEDLAPPLCRPLAQWGLNSGALTTQPPSRQTPHKHILPSYNDPIK